MVLDPQTIQITQAQDLTLRFTLDRKRSVSGWAVTFTVRSKVAGTSQIAKSASLTDSTNGVFSVALAKADTSSMTASTDLSSGESYVWDLKRTDSGSNVQLAKGDFILDAKVTA